MTDKATIFNIGDVVELQLLRKDDELVQLKCNIYDVEGDEKIIVSAPIHRGQMYPISLGTRVYVIYFKKDAGMYSFNGLVIGRGDLDNLPVLHILRADEIRKSQRRRFFRINFFRDFVLLRDLPPEEIQMPDPKLVEKYKDNKDILREPITHEEIKVTGRDLSGGGFKCTIMTVVKIGERLKGQMLLDGYLLEFEVEIVRSDKLAATNEYLLGCKFINLDEQQRSKIINFIFKKQRNQVKKD